MRSFNFCAGPAMLPEEVLVKAQTELLDYKSTGMSIMEMSHRSPWFDEVIDTAKVRLRSLMAIPDTHEILFLHGGATTQFHTIAQQFNVEGRAAYLNTGQWSTKAIKAAQALGLVDVLASTEFNGFTSAPLAKDLPTQTSQYNYLHYTPNETIGGVRFNYVPKVECPLVADFSSSILSEYIDVSKYDFIYAGAQKNIGPAGVVVVIASKAFLDRASGLNNKVFDYRAQLEADSRVNTPPTYSIYLAGLVFEWLEAQGGVESLESMNRKKAQLLYHAIDSDDFYSNPISVESRSLMNVPFKLADDALNSVFEREASESRLYNLAGHRSVGGMRASIYNAMPLKGVTALTDFMADFSRRYG